MYIQLYNNNNNNNVNNNNNNSVNREILVIDKNTVILNYFIQNEVSITFDIPSFLLNLNP